MTTRRRDSQTLGEYSWILESGDSAVQGEAAGLDTATGTIRPMGTSATQIMMGFFAETLTGDGTLKVRVTLPDEANAEWLANDDSPNDVAATDIGSEVYAKDGSTVSTLSTSRSKAGRVLDYDADLDIVLVQGGTAVTGPTGASGIAGAVADRAALSAVTAASRVDGQVVMVLSDRSLWVFDDAGVATEDEAQELIVEPDAGAGQWLRADPAFIARIPISYTNTDGEAIWTIPAGFAVRLIGLPCYDITTAFTGGSSAAIGASTSITGYDTKGDVIGGASGDVLAGLTAGVRAGTLGGELNDTAGLAAMLFVEGDEVQFDRITDAFTAGAGFICLPVAQTVPA